MIVVYERLWLISEWAEAEPAELRAARDATLALDAREDPLLELLHLHLAGRLSLLSQMRFVYPYRHATVLSRVPEQLLRADLLAAAGRSDEALRWVESAAFNGPYEVAYRGPTLERAYRLALKMHRRDRALDALLTLRDLWRDVEPSFAARRAQVIEELQRLGAR